MPTRLRPTINPSFNLQFGGNLPPVSPFGIRQSEIGNSVRPSVPSCLRASPRPAFTLLELLVVMGIIVLLAAILVPVVSQVRMKGYVTSTQAQMARIAAAIESYYHDFKAYPGPIPNNQLTGPAQTSPWVFTMDPQLQSPPNINPKLITSSENLILGLYGILTPPQTPGQPVLYSGAPPIHDVLGLNPLRPTSYHYMDYIPEELSVPSGYAYSARLGIADTSAGAQLLTDAKALVPAADPSQNTQVVGKDSAIPEFMDRIPSYMPIIYIRANVGIPAKPDGTGIATTDMTARPAQYDVNQLTPYGFNTVSYNPPVTTPDFTLPSGMTVTTDAQWVAYFMNPNIVGQPRGKDGFILISAGADRLFGTKDDIIVTP